MTSTRMATGPMTGMARRGTTGRLAAVLVATLAALGAGGASAATFLIEIARTSPDEGAPTFEGQGRLTVSDAAQAPRMIDALSLTIATLGTRGEDREPVTHRFDYGLSDLVSASGLDAVPLPSDLGGVSLSFGPKASRDGTVTLGASGFGTLTIDLGGTAQGFCFMNEDSGECIRGGGTSTSIEALASAAPIPLPGTLPLALAALGGLGLLASRRGRGTARDEPAMTRGTW